MSQIFNLQDNCKINEVAKNTNHYYYYYFYLHECVRNNLILACNAKLTRYLRNARYVHSVWARPKTLPWGVWPNVEDSKAFLVNLNVESDKLLRLDWRTRKCGAGKPFLTLHSKPARHTYEMFAEQQSLMPSIQKH